MHTLLGMVLREALQALIVNGGPAKRWYPWTIMPKINGVFKKLNWVEPKDCDVTFTPYTNQSISLKIVSVFIS